MKCASFFGVIIFYFLSSLDASVTFIESNPIPIPTILIFWFPNHELENICQICGVNKGDHRGESEMLIAWWICVFSLDYLRGERECLSWSSGQNALFPSPGEVTSFRPCFSLIKIWGKLKKLLDLRFKNDISGSSNIVLLCCVVYKIKLMKFTNSKKTKMIKYNHWSGTGHILAEWKAKITLV